jgi:NTP pyrophosphatase (non-canonical NTP hydrolase)
MNLQLKRRIQAFLHPEESLRNIQEDIGDWSQRQFPNGSTRGLLAHIRSEVDELQAELSGPSGDPADYDDVAVAHEIADIVILTANLSRRLNVDLVQAVNDKMWINYHRTWSTKPDPKTGMLKHIEEE